MAHLTDADRGAYLASLTPGVDIDHRGTPFTQPLLDELLNSLRLSTTGRVNIRDAQFEGAVFSGEADFDGALFNGDAQFGMAQFSGQAHFVGAEFAGYAGFVGAQFRGDTHSFMEVQFSNDARFDMARFDGHAWFDRVRFSADAGFNGVQFSGESQSFVRAVFDGDAQFAGVQFSGEARFDGARFSREAPFVNARFSRVARFVAARFEGGARFDGAEFSRHGWFDKARFSGHAWFTGAEFIGQARFHGVQITGSAGFGGARFAAMSWFGPMVCRREVDLSGALFEVAVTLEIAAHEVHFVRTQWNSTATIRLRYATADLSHAVLSSPVAVTAQPARFIADSTPVDESLLPGPAEVRVASVQGVDAAHLVLTDADLTNCLFSGAFHLDQFRLEGRTIFAFPPTGLHRRGIFWPARWTRRRTLAEEHHWRAQAAGQPTLPAGGTPPDDQWRLGPHHPDPAQTPSPEDVAALYLLTELVEEFLQVSDPILGS
ncbi:pentapeptide repeat-containing protein, partial [Streptomyces alanosinicus]|uniref:pentapeptide repeat-containing protein n=1 Tax=Streptomyces alanosinicus TaxID=68171 RepID=UPI001E312A54